jgi:hypothetical protein
VRPVPYSLVFVPSLVWSASHTRAASTYALRGADCEAVDTLRGADCAAIDTRRVGAWSGLQKQSTRRVERIAWQSTRVECVRGAGCICNRHVAWSGLRSNRHAWCGMRGADCKAIDTLRGADCAAIDTRGARCVERIARQSSRCVERIAQQSTREVWVRSPRAAERASTDSRALHRSWRAAKRPSGVSFFSSTCRARTVGHWQPLCLACARPAIRRLGAVREGRERVGHARRPLHARCGAFRRD